MNKFKVTTKLLSSSYILIGCLSIVVGIIWMAYFYASDMQPESFSIFQFSHTQIHVVGETDRTLVSPFLYYGGYFMMFVGLVMATFGYLALWFTENLVKNDPLRTRSK